MRFKDVFSIIGPAMVGPSSSHTAGAVRIGRVARMICDALPTRAEIIFFGSFAETYRGHGTDLAIVGGLLDWDTDDDRIRHSLRKAKELGIEVTFEIGRERPVHPNTAEIRLHHGDEVTTVMGASIGGGNIEIFKVNGFDVKFGAQYPSLLIFHHDRPGMIAEVTGILSQHHVNIAYMDVDRKGRNGQALTVIEADGAIDPKVTEAVSRLSDVHKIVILHS